jgi:NitT/TauT family transport system substrate-binding protein
MFRRLTALIFVLALPVSPALAQAPLENAVLAIPAFSFSFSTAYLAEDLGIWAKNGLAMKSIQIAGVGATNAVIAGSADFSIASPLTVTRAAAHGQRLLAIAQTLDRLFVEIALRKDLAEAAGFDPKAPYEKRALALKGRTIAVESINSIIHAYVLLMAHRAGLSYDDVRIAVMQPNSMIAAFDSKQIDGFSMSLPWPLVPVLAGTAVTLESGVAGDPPDMVPFGHNVIVALPATCEKRRSICQKTGKSFADAAAFMQDHPSEALALLAKRFPTLDAKVLAAAFDEARKATPRIPAPTRQALENAETYNVDAGLMKPEEKLKNFDGLYTDEFVK